MLSRFLCRVQNMHPQCGVHIAPEVQLQTVLPLPVFAIAWAVHAALGITKKIFGLRQPCCQSYIHQPKNLVKISGSQ
jgi:hypothetical protein